MSSYLRYSGFEWLNQNEIDVFNVHSVGENSLHGYILEVKLEHPDKIHNA